MKAKKIITNTIKYLWENSIWIVGTAFFCSALFIQTESVKQDTAFIMGILFFIYARVDQVYDLLKEKKE
jgi:hypothetical protein